MDSLFLEGIAPRTIRDWVSQGKAVRICRGLILKREATPRELAIVLTRRYPRLALDGSSAAEHHLGRRLTFPLHVMNPRQRPPSKYFRGRRRTPIDAFEWEGVRVCPPLQAVEALDESEAVRFLEAVYRGRDGTREVDLQVPAIKRVPVRTRELLRKAVIGADSEPERVLSVALRRAGFAVENNSKIGRYRWDIKLEEHRIAIEVDGYEYHNGENRHTFEIDRYKLNDAVHRNWRPMRFTASSVKHHLDRVVGQIEAVARGGPALEPPWEWHVFWR